MKTRYISAMTAAILVIFFGLFYVLFDHYLSSTAKETITAWVKGEENSIIEGNLLSSITKTQKILLSSEIIKAVVVLDKSDKQQRLLVEFGERVDFEKISINTAEIQNTGLFKKYLVVTVPNNADIKIVFSIYSQKVNDLFWITSALFSVLTLAFGFSLLLVKKSAQIKTEKYASKAKQAAHDLAQPIVVLNSLTTRFHENSEETIKSVISRINAIVDDLTDKKISLKNNDAQKNTISLNKKLENLVNEKRLSKSNLLNISFESVADVSLLKVDHDYFLRVISNLMQNSIEAQAMNISLLVESSEEHFVFKIIDDGKGIPNSIIKKLGEKGFSHGKKFGTGLGLYGAFEFANQNYGSIEIESIEGAGTTIKLILPKSAVPKLLLATDTQVLVLDDDVNVLSAWQSKLKNYDFKNPPEFFEKTTSLNKRLEQLDKNEVFIFSDYNLNESINGLEFIESHNLENQAALITGQSNDAEIIEKAQSLKVQLISKQDLQNFKIELV